MTFFWKGGHIAREKLLIDQKYGEWSYWELSINNIGKEPVECDENYVF
jgi:hypothetical protein